MSRVYSVPGYEPEDLQQEAQLALLQAGSPSGALATVVVQRRLVSLLRAAGRDRRRTLDESARADALDLVPSGCDPCEVVCARDRLRRMGAALTHAERRALVALVAGVPFAHDRRVENHVRRAKTKLRGIL